MSISVIFAGANILQPGAYSETLVVGNQVASPSVGIVALIGEADEGAPFSAESGLSAVTYGPDEFAAIKDKYVSGELVDAASLVINPANDPQISGGAQQIILLKTNASVAASLSIVAGASAYGTLTAQSPGVSGNNISYACSIVSGQAVITISRLDTGVTEISNPIGNDTALTLTCTDAGATAATVTISATSFTTMVTGGTTAQNLNISLANFNSISQLAAFINVQPGYTATVTSSQIGNKPVSNLDRVTAQSIKTAYGICTDAADIAAFFAQSSLVNFTQAIFTGIPSTKPQTFLTGGALGGTTAAAIQNCYDVLLKLRVNSVVPLFSEDATADISLGITDSASNYTIDAIHAGLLSHVNQASTVTGRKERLGYASYKGTFADSQEKSAILSAARVSLCFQDIKALSSSSESIVDMQPHMLSVISAGIRAAAPVGLPTTFKNINAQGISHVDFDPETMGNQAIAANLVYVEASPQGGFRIKLDNSTYASNVNPWIYNRPAVLNAADLIAYVIRTNLEQFIGRRNSDVSAATVTSFMIGIMDSLKTLGATVADAKNGGLGYTNLNVTINGSMIAVDVSPTLVEGLEFALSTIRVQRAG